jgi:hypothetical protein
MESRVCIFQYLLGIASAAFLRSESYGTHEHIYLSLFLRLYQPGEPCSCIYFSQEQSSPVIHPGIGVVYLIYILLHYIYFKQARCSKLCTLKGSSGCNKSLITWTIMWMTTAKFKSRDVKLFGVVVWIIWLYDRIRMVFERMYAYYKSGCSSKICQWCG